MRRQASAHKGVLVLALALWLAWATSALAAARLLAADELIRALKSAPPCCVVDARSADQQRKHPLAEALPYRADMTIIPTASVIVVADRDQDALAIAKALAKKHPGKVIYAVKGGVAAWASVLKSLSDSAASAAPGAPAGINFVIPHNTCETGQPLQILRSKTKP